MNKKSSTLKTLISGLLLSVLFISFVGNNINILAQTPPPPPPSPGTDNTDNTGTGLSGFGDLSGIDVLKKTCLWPNQKLADETTCTADQSLTVQIWNFLVQFATVVASLALVAAGYYMIVGNETMGRTLLRRAIIGLITVLSASTIVDLIKSMFTTTPGTVSINPVLTFVKALVNGLVIPASSVVAVVFFIIGAYNLLMAGGNQKMVADGWNYIRNAVWGLIMVMLAFSIVQIVAGVVNGFLA